MSRSRSGLVIAGPTAGRLMGLRLMPNDRRIHVLAPPASNPSTEPWVVPFRTASFNPKDVVERDDGIRLLGLPRLALDLSRYVTDLSLMSIVEQCLVDGRHSAEELFETAVVWMSPRRRWVRRFLEVLDRRIDGPPAESHLEVVVGDCLQAAGVGGLVRQYWIRPTDHRPIRFDLAVPKLKWAVEVDGFSTHRELRGARADRRRDQASASLGWLVRRLGPTDVGATLDSSIEFLLADITARLAS